MNTKSLQGPDKNTTTPEGRAARPQAKLKAQTKGAAFGLLFKGQGQGEAAREGVKPEERDAKAKEAAMAQLVQLMVAPPKPEVKAPLANTADAAQPQGLKQRGGASAALLERGQAPTPSTEEAKVTLRASVSGPADLALAPSAGTFLPLGLQGARQDLPARQDFTLSLEHIQRALSPNPPSPADHQLLLRTFEGGGQLELQLGSGELASTLRMTVQAQRVELSMEGGAHAQLDKLKQTLIDSGFEVTIVPMTSDAQGQDQSLDQHKQPHHEAARAALEVRLRLRGAQGWDERAPDHGDDPHHVTRTQARLGVLVDEIV